ncbi:MAG: efflux RND transporter periplasmic adaptor subunit [Pyrinomonadaceae bacterium]|nr:efflux RND transporter periplasmic adaptor subunit [Pyrinomonadaceae bacterium]
MKLSKLLFLFGLSLFVGACGGKTAENSANANSADSKTQIVDIKTTSAIQRDLPTYFEATGTLASDAQTDVAPTIGGKIIEVNFDVGSYVNKGDVLVRLDPRDAQIRLETAEAQVNQQRNLVKQAEAQVEQSRQGVKTAQAQVDQAIANLRQAQIRLNVKDGEIFDIETFSQVRSVNAQLALAEKELGRAERLLATGDVSKSLRDQRLSQRDALLGQLAEARSNAAVAVKAIETARSAVNTAKQGVNTAQTQVNTSLTNVNNAKAAVATALTNVDQARKTVSDTAIYAPISGYISERVADLGEFTNPNAPNTKICTILRTAILRLRVDVPEQNIGKVSEGQSVSMKVSAYPDRNFAGTITRILPQVNVNSRTLTVEAEVESQGGMLKPGLFATARIAQTKSEPTILVPQTAVRTDGGVNKVFVIQDGRAVEKLVQIGDTENDLIQIKNGLKENEQVAISNIEQLFDGVTVRQ